MRERLQYLNDQAQEFVWFMEHCSTDTFFKLGSLYEDIVGNEKTYVLTSIAPTVFLV